jgi:hypothetical protein
MYGALHIFVNAPIAWLDPRPAFHWVTEILALPWANQQGAGYGMPPMGQPGYGMGAPAPGFGYAGPMLNQGMMPGPPMGMAYGAPQQPMAGYPMQMPMQTQMQQPVNVRG